jgi:hypothetical protein
MNTYRGWATRAVRITALIAALASAVLAGAANWPKVP